MLKYRILTAALLLPVVFLVVWFLPMPWFALLVGAVIVWAGWEWSRLVGLVKNTWRIGYTILIALALISTYYLPVNWVLFIALIAWLWAGSAMLSYAVGSHALLGLQYPALKALMGIFALIPCWLAINVLRETIGGPVWLLFGLILIWMGMDTGAYVAGRLWGKHPLASRVSPQKTWEGFFGGLILSLIIAITISLIFYTPLYRLLMICTLTLITNLFAALGDLVESMLKRQAGMKDSGVGLPGHGGILDRMDSIAAGLPIFALGTLLLL